MPDILIIAIIVAAVVVLVNKRAKEKKKKAHQEILAELGELSWSGAKDALLKLKEIHQHADHKEVRDVARHYLTVWVGDMMSYKTISLKEAFTAKERFELEMKEIRELNKFFGLHQNEISPFSEEEILAAYLRCQTGVLEQALEHYPEKAWIEFSPGDILGALTTYSDTTYTSRNIEKWRGWIRSAYLRQAKRELRRLRRREYSSVDETNMAVDKISTLLSNAKAEPKEIETTWSEIDGLRQTAATYVN